MQPYTRHPEVFAHPIRLETSLQSNPLQVLKTFCAVFDLPEAKQQLANLTEAALTSNHHLFEEGEQRSDLFRYFRLMEELLEAVYIMSGTVPKGFDGVPIPTAHNE